MNLVGAGPATDGAPLRRTLAPTKLRYGESSRAHAISTAVDAIVRLSPTW